MRIGDLVTYGGRPCYVRGFDPMSVPEQRLYLRRADTREELTVALREVEDRDLVAALLERVAERDASD